MSAGKRAGNLPVRSDEQRMRALRRANEVRSARAKLKQDLAAGRIELAEIVQTPPAYAATARVRELLLVLPKVGSVKAGRILSRCGIAHSRTLAGLTDRQPTALITLFRH